MNISDYLRTALINHSLGVVNYVPAHTVWAALYTSPPTSAGGGIEVTASDYSRVSTSWEIASLGVTSNSLDIRFPSSGTTLSSWGTVNSLALLDAPTGGNILYFGPLSAPVILSLGTDFKVALNNLTITLQ